jgi:hypothetical protein
MKRKTVCLIGAGTVVVACVGAAMAAAFSYVTSAGDESRWGVRIARRLGVKPALDGMVFSSAEALAILKRADFTGLLHLALMKLSSEDRKTALAHLNTHRASAGRPSITDDDLAAFTEGFRQAMSLPSPQERDELLANFNAHRAVMGLDPITDKDLTTPVAN